MATRKAFVVTRGEVTVGYLGEGPGPFVSLVHSALPHPWLDVARFNCRTRTDEAKVSEVLAHATAFDAVVNGLQALGYALTAASYTEYFAEPEDSPRGSPVRSEDGGGRG